MAGLQGRAIIVTGAGRGLGAAYACYLADMGASVVVNDIDADSASATVGAIGAAGGRAVGHVADVTDWQAAGELVHHCVDAFGSVDGLVNNAAIFSMARLDEMEEADIGRPFTVNVVGPCNCAAHAVRFMLRQGRGSIVNVVSGAHMGIPAMGIYGATKGAVASLTYTWALELADTGVRVNAISPLGTSQMVQANADYCAAHGRPFPGAPAIEPEANAPVVAYLLSEDSVGVNGQLVRIEGEQLALLTHPAIMLPVLERRGGWSYEAVCEAFEGDLAERQAPVGITGLEPAAYRPASRFWSAPEGED